MHYQTEVQLSQVKYEAYLCCSDMGHISTASDKTFAQLQTILRVIIFIQSGNYMRRITLGSHRVCALKDCFGRRAKQKDLDYNSWFRFLE